MAKDAVRKSWEEKIVKFKESGQSQSQWCRENGVNLRTFNVWYNRLKKQTTSKPDTVSWFPVNIIEKAPLKTITLKINGATIDISEGFDPKLLAEVIKVLGAIC